MSNETTALCNAVSRRIFAPLFRARWQNMQNLVNDSVFMSMAPPAYLPYYRTYISQWLQWSRGFVPQLHRQDFFSTGMGYTVCDIMTKECMSGGYRLHSEDANTKAFIEDWCKDDLNNVLNKMFFDANAGGNAILVLTPADGELYPAVYPIDRVFFQIGRTGMISSIRIINRFTSGETAYYARETRAMYNGSPYWLVELARGTMVTSPSWGNNSERRVPDIIKAQWEYCYGDIEPNKWYRMPDRMRTIGCYNVKNKALASAIADMPGYSDSSLHTALDVLYSIDFNYTQGQVDQYLGKGRALIPKQMGRIPVGLPSDGIYSLSDALSESRSQMRDTSCAPLDEMFFTQISDGTVSGESVKPTFIQADLRGEARKFIRDADIELLASKVGLSASTIASHLAGGGTSKTDDEINAQNSATEKTVGNKRALASRAINSMLSDVAYFYGYPGEIDIQWGRAAANSARENSELLADYREGTLPLRDYLRRRWTDLTEEEVERMAQDVERETEIKRRAEMEPFFNEGSDNTDYFGVDANEDREQTA